MTQEIGTLKELNVQPGDVVQIVSGGKNNPVEHFDATHATINKRKGVFTLGGSYTYDYDAKFAIISRAAQPLPHGHARLPSGEVVDLTENQNETPWKNMTAEEKGAILVAWQSGKDIEWSSGNGYWGVTDTDPTEWHSDAYRVRPQPRAPKVEEVVLYGRHDVQWVFERSPHDTHSIAFNLIDGEPDVSSVRMVKL